MKLVESIGKEMHYLAAVLLFCVSHAFVDAQIVTESICIPDVGLVSSVQIRRATPDDPADPCPANVFDNSLATLFVAPTTIPDGCVASVLTPADPAESGPTCTERERSGVITIDLNYDVIIRCEPTEAELQEFFEARADELARALSSGSDIPRTFNDGRVRVRNLGGTGRGTGRRGTGSRSGSAAGSVVGFCNDDMVDVSEGVTAATCTSKLETHIYTEC